MKNVRKKIIGSIALAIIIISGSTIYIYNKNMHNPILSDKEYITITVEKGEGFYSLLSRLKNEGLLRNELMTKLYLKINGERPNVIAGKYTVDSNITLKKLINTLQTQDGIKVVIPEGYDISEIGSELQKVGLFSKEDFIKAVENYKLPPFIQRVQGRRYALEGFLFPDTYNFPKKSTPDDVIKIMLDKFKAEIEEIQKENGVNLTPEQISEIVTKASIIENEARVNDERPLISSVIDNRLKINMPLQIDATVIYALGKHVDVVTYKDLKIDSRYNTYKYKGLPIGPISNPGKQSLEAALNPASTNYLYYILVPGTDKHDFTTNGVEFNKLRKKYGYDN